MVRSRVGLLELDDPATSRAKLTASLELHVPDETERRWMEPKLEQLLGFSDSDSGCISSGTSTVAILCLALTCACVMFSNSIFSCSSVSGIRCAVGVASISIGSTSGSLATPSVTTGETKNLDSFLAGSGFKLKAPDERGVVSSIGACSDCGVGVIGCDWSDVSGRKARSRGTGSGWK